MGPAGGEADDRRDAELLGEGGAQEVGAARAFRAAAEGLARFEVAQVLHQGDLAGHRLLQALGHRGHGEAGLVLEAGQPFALLAFGEDENRRGDRQENDQRPVEAGTGERGARRAALRRFFHPCFPVRPNGPRGTLTRAPARLVRRQAFVGPAAQAAGGGAGAGPDNAASAEALADAVEQRHQLPLLLFAEVDQPQVGVLHRGVEPGQQLEAGRA